MESHIHCFLSTRVCYLFPSLVKINCNQLLVELDGFKASEGIIVVAATNFPEVLDKVPRGGIKEGIKRVG